MRILIFIILHSAFILFYDPQKMRDLRDNAACRRRIRTDNRLVELCDAQALDDLFLFLRVADHAPVILDLDLPAFFVSAFFAMIFQFEYQFD